MANVERNPFVIQQYNRDLAQKVSRLILAHVEDVAEVAIDDWHVYIKYEDGSEHHMTVSFPHSNFHFRSSR